MDINAETGKLLHKIEDYKLKSSELESFTDNLEELILEKKPGLKKISKDDIEWLRVYALLLRKIEARDEGKNYRFEAGEWRELKAEFEKLKSIIDDLEMYGILTQVRWFLGGGCHYSILDRTKILEFIYEKIVEIINKIESDKLKTQVAINEVSPVSLKPLIERDDKMFFRTNLKRIESGLKETVDALKDIVSQDDIEKWVQQFEEDDEQKICLKLLKNIRFYDQKEIRNLCKTLNTKLQLDLDTEDLSRVIFVPVGGSGKSGQMFGYLYRIANNISEKNMIYFENLDKAKGYNTIVFIDDFVATGSQFIDFIENDIRVDLGDLKSKNINIYYLALLGFEKGINKIERKKNIKVKVAQKLNEKDLPLSESCNILTEEERKKAKETLERYGNKLYKNNPLGFQNFGALIAFEHRVPNNTFPVIWSSAKGWFPIFKRYHQ